MYVHTFEFYSAIKRNKLVTYGKPQIDLKQNYAQWMKPDAKDYMHSYEVLKQAEFIYDDREQNSCCFWQQGRGEGNGKIVGKWHVGTFWHDGNVLCFDQGWVAVVYTFVKIDQTLN